MQNDYVASRMELELPPDFKELFRLLNVHRVEYLLIGGYAVICHGHVRATLDMDVVVSHEEANAKKVVEALRDFGFGEAALQPEVFTQPNSLVRMGFPPVKIEILNYLKGVPFPEAYARRDVRSVEDITIDLISMQDLIANKKAVGRPQDLADVAALQKLVR